MVTKGPTTVRGAAPPQQRYGAVPGYGYSRQQQQQQQPQQPPAQAQQQASDGAGAVATAAAAGGNAASRGGPAGNGAGAVAPSKVRMVEKEEERVNAQLVDILERKCSKLRKSVEEEAERRRVAENQVAPLAAEVESLRRQLQEKLGVIGNMESAHQALLGDRNAAHRAGAAAQCAEAGRDEARRALEGCRADLERQRAEQQRGEAEWKAQILKLVTSEQEAAQRAEAFRGELEELREKRDVQMAGAKDLMSRYEEESEKRLAAEERCLELEEKLKNLGKRTRDDADSAQQKAKQARQRAEEMLKGHEARESQAKQRIEELEKRCKALEAEVRALRAKTSAIPGSLDAANHHANVAEVPTTHKAHRPPVDTGRPQPGVQVQVAAYSTAAEAQAAAAAGAVLPPSRLPAPKVHSRPGSAASRPGSALSEHVPPAAAAAAAYGGGGSRPGTASSAPERPAPSAGPGTATPTAAHGQSTNSVGSDKSRSSSAAPARGNRNRPTGLPPGAIRRAGSTPVQPRHPGIAAGTAGYSQQREACPQPQQQMQKLPPSRAGERMPSGSYAQRAEKQTARVSQQPGSAPSSRPPSRGAASDMGDLQIDDRIPSGSEMDSSDEELLVPVQAKR
eukprot:TRINITY_DN16251_c0_g1_i1.p1 TRINITY_DN16251_c0_g1~~TRINITY_DN16251_c0_g1_i1.p1  ORF type:complete len:622 (+),score=186.57 TRINITY_DN16251_c0_g1_i1:116-1981(+)